MTNEMDRPTEIPAERAPSMDHHYGESAPSRRGTGGLFPASALASPMFEGKDVAGLIGAVAITLGPLAAYSFGWGA